MEALADRDTWRSPPDTPLILAGAGALVAIFIPRAQPVT